MRGWGAPSALEPYPEAFVGSQLNPPTPQFHRFPPPPSPSNIQSAGPDLPQPPHPSRDPECFPYFNTAQEKICILREMGWGIVQKACGVGKKQRPVFINV